MSDSQKAEHLPPQLQALADTVRELARGYQGNSLSLLALLRLLEQMHQEVRDGVFQDSLPDNRQALYSLLKDIEATGGWPYIHRMKLQLLLKKFPIDSTTEFLLELLPESAPATSSRNSAD
jgi:hypothetical protein